MDHSCSFLENFLDSTQNNITLSYDLFDEDKSIIFGCVYTKIDPLINNVLGLGAFTGSTNHKIIDGRTIWCHLLPPKYIPTIEFYSLDVFG